MGVYGRPHSDHKSLKHNYRFPGDCNERTCIALQRENVEGRESIGCIACVRVSTAANFNNTVPPTCALVPPEKHSALRVDVLGARSERPNTVALVFRVHVNAREASSVQLALVFCTSSSSHDRPFSCSVRICSIPALCALPLLNCPFSCYVRILKLYPLLKNLFFLQSI